MASRYAALYDELLHPGAAGATAGVPAVVAE